MTLNFFSKGQNRVEVRISSVEATTFRKGLAGECFRLRGWMSCGSPLAAPQHSNKWAWLCFGKTSLTEAGVGLEVAHWLKFVDLGSDSF